MSLDRWRRLLWVQALGDQYNKFADDIYQIWLKLRYDLLALPQEIQNFLKILGQSYLIGLITNGTSRAQWEKITKLNLQPFFDVILVSGDLPWEKPHEEIFHEACVYLGVKPSQCFMVGDKLETDILGGIKANLGATIWVPLCSNNNNNNDLTNCNNSNLNPRPDYVISDVNDLFKLLPENPKPLKVRNRNRFLVAHPPDLEDNNSNCSDGS